MVQLTALIVEDNDFDRKRVIRLARRVQIPLAWIEARSVHEAREALARQRFDLIVMDYLLGDGTGLELAHEITNGSFGDPMPTILLTGYGTELLSLQARVAGCAGYLAKRDLDPVHFRKIVTTALGQETMPDTTIEPQADPMPQGELSRTQSQDAATLLISTEGHLALLTRAIAARDMDKSRDMLITVVSQLADIWNIFETDTEMQE